MKQSKFSFCQFILKKCIRGRCSTILAAPKSLKYWHFDKSGTVIDKNAPKWAKEEFEKYEQIIAQSGKPDKNGLVKYI